MRAPLARPANDEWMPNDGTERRKPMKSRERILKVLRGERPDRIPWMPLMYHTYFASLPEYRDKFGLQADDITAPLDTPDQVLEELAFRVSYTQSLGADFMDWGGISPHHTVYDAEVRFEQVQEGDMRLDRFITPIGSISQKHWFSRSGKTYFRSEGLLRTVEDYRVFAYAIEHSRLVPDFAVLDAFLEVIGDAGVAFVKTEAAPIKHWLLGEMMVEDLAYALADHPAELGQLEAVAHARNLEMCRIEARSRAQVFEDFAVTGTGMISPAIYRDHYLQFHKECARILHAGGKVFLDHTSGEPLRGIVHMVAESEVDGLYGLSLPEFGHGDMTLAELRAVMGPRVTLFASMEPHLLATGTMQEVQEAAKRVLDLCAEVGGPLILGTADDTPFGAPPANIAAVSEVVERYGRI